MGILTGSNRVAAEQGIGKYYSKTSVEGYYNDLTCKVNEKTLLDTEGIPVNVIEKGIQVHFPISIFQYALGLWDLYLASGNENYKDNFLKQAFWIEDSQRCDGSWNCFEAIGYKQLTVSSMGQGEAISVLSRAYQLDHKEHWLRAAERAAAFMVLPLEKGGTLRATKNGPVFEEYADLEGTKEGVLNGWIFSLFGLYDYLKIKDDESLHHVYEASIRALELELPHYDMKYWSYYDRTGRIASPAYHELHVALLTVLSDITGIQTFVETAQKWKQYADSPINKMRAISRKAIQKFKESPEGIIIQ